MSTNEKIQVRVVNEKKKGQGVKVGCPCGKGQAVIFFRSPTRKSESNSLSHYERTCSARCGGVLELVRPGLHGEPFSIQWTWPDRDMPEKAATMMKSVERYEKAKDKRPFWAKSWDFIMKTLASSESNK